MWGREIAKTTCLIAALLVLNALIGHWYVNVVMKGSIPALTYLQFEPEAARVDTLVLGDSHAKLGLRTSILENAFNLAVPGQLYTETYYTLASQLERSDTEIRYVVIGADPTSFAEERLDEWPYLHHYANYVNYVEIGRKRGRPFEYAIRQQLGHFAPYVGRRNFMLSHLGRGEIRGVHLDGNSRMERGALLSDETLTPLSKQVRARRAKRRADLHFGDGAPFHPLLFDYFRRIIALCADHDIEVLVVKFPLTPDYVTAASRHIDLAEFDRELDALIAPYANAHLLDARSWFKGDPSLFRDSDHLNAKGASKLSRTIRRELSELRRRAS